MLTCYSSSSNEAQLREAVERLCEDVSGPGIYGEELVTCNPDINFE